MSEDDEQEFYDDGYRDAWEWNKPYRGAMFTEQARAYLRGYSDGIMERGWPDTFDDVPRPI